MVKILRDKDQIETFLTSASIDQSEQLSQRPQENQTIKEIISVLPKGKNTQTTKQNLKKSFNFSSSIIKCCKWSKIQTQHFFSMLEIYGTDFSLMCHSKIFQNKRTKKELLNKYKKQSKINSSKIDEIFYKKTHKFMNIQEEAYFLWQIARQNARNKF